MKPWLLSPPEDLWIFKLLSGSVKCAVPKEGLRGTESFGQINMQTHMQDEGRKEISAVP